jgi:hypothetical protein
MNQQISNFLNTHIESSVYESEFDEEICDDVAHEDADLDSQTHAMSMHLEIDAWARRTLASNGFGGFL